MESKSTDIIIEFGYSPSRYYQHALNLARTLNGYEETGTGKHRITRFLFEVENDICVEVFKLVIGWANTRAIKSDEVARLTAILNWFWCYQGRRESYNGVYYCFMGRNVDSLFPFGCHADRMFGCNEYSVGFESPSRLLSFGFWGVDGIWHFDKNAMLEFVRQIYFPIRLCPAFDHGFATEMITLFPDSIDLAKDRDWMSTRDGGIAPRNRKSAFSIFAGIVRKMSQRTDRNILESLKIQGEAP